MADFFFISYSSVDGKDFALKLADEMEAGPPPIAVWLDGRKLRPGEDWDEQVVEAIRACKGVLFVMSKDGVRPQSVCKDEWVRALKYKKPVIPLRLGPGVELPFRLGSREYIDFSGPFDPAVAQLRKHLAWMDSPEGQLQALKYRLSDAQRELPRAQPDQQARVQEDITELGRQIAEQQRVVDNPKAAEQRVRQSIEAGLEGERKPAQSASGISRRKFVNPPPLIAPSWFQDRDVETGLIVEFLEDESLRLMTVIGRGGVGKTAMVCRLLRSLESGQISGDRGALTVDGIVYLSAARSFHRPNVPDLYTGLTSLLPDEMVKQLDLVYKNPQSTTRATMEALVQAFAQGRTVVLLDNFEDLVAVETGQIKNAELEEALRALLELPPHGLKIIITTRVALGDLALVQPGLQRRLDLDAGLAQPYAENILRAMDVDGKAGLRTAPERLLAQARERTLGFPRALEHLFGILSADRDTSLEQILDATRNYLPEQVVTVLVGEAFSRLDPTAQRVMEALAVYRYPVPPAAVDYLLQPYIPGVNSGRVLSRLVNMQFVRRDAGRYYLHQVDREYALSRIEEGDAGDRDAGMPPLTRYALLHRAAEWFKLTRKPRESWKALNDLAAQMSEFALRCECGEFDTAAAVLLEVNQELDLWGHYRLLIELHARLQGKIADPALARTSAVNFGLPYWRTGDIQKAISLFEQALELARKHNDRSGEGEALGNLALCFSDLGQNDRAIEYFEQDLAISRELRDREGESIAQGNLGLRYAEIGQHTRAVEHIQQALDIDREEGGREAQAHHQCTLAFVYLDQDRVADAWRCFSEALPNARAIGYRLIEAYAQAGLGECRMRQDKWNEAAPELERAIEIADDIGSRQVSERAREGLALIHVYRNELSAARITVEGARRCDVPRSNHRISAMLGLVALRQGDLNTARAAFEQGVKEAEELIALTPDRYAALDTKGLCLCGLALCGDTARIPEAKAAYGAARAVTSDGGITRAVLQRFDALALADGVGMLGEVRAVAAGVRKVSMGG